MTRDEIANRIDTFADAFNRLALDEVMTFFSASAVYEPGDGKRHAGFAAIRAAFEPQFSGAFGGMRFDTRDLVIDVAARKAAFRWVCRHDLDALSAQKPFDRLRRAGMRLLFGGRFAWQGLDVFHFDANGKIVGKFTYGWYGAFPHLQRES